MDNWSVEYYKSLLSSSDKLKYDIIYQNWQRFNSVVSLPYSSMNVNQLSNIIEALVKDHPEIFWVNYFKFSIQQSIISCKLITNNFFSDREIQMYQNLSYAWQYRIANKIPKYFSIKEKIWILFDYLARQVTYGKQCDAFSHTILGCMTKHNHTSVCEGIAKSFKFLCDGIGIPCIVVFGDVDFGPGHQGSHAWNIVSYDGIKRHIDVTKELEAAQRYGKATRTSFLSCDREMDIYTWNKRIVPKCR